MIGPLEMLIIIPYVIFNSTIENHLFLYIIILVKA
jgi:hypothetical protein